MATVKKRKLVFETNYHLMPVKSIAECSPYFFTFIKPIFVINIFVLSILEWPFYTGVSVFQYNKFKPSHIECSIDHKFINNFLITGLVCARADVQGSWTNTRKERKGYESKY